MRLSEYQEVTDIANTRVAAGTLLDALERGLELEISVSGLEGIALTFAGKELPGLETWLRNIIAETADDLTMRGVEPDTPLSVLPAEVKADEAA